MQSMYLSPLSNPGPNTDIYQALSGESLTSVGQGVLGTAHRPPQAKAGATLLEVACSPEKKCLAPISGNQESSKASQGSWEGHTGLSFWS